MNAPFHEQQFHYSCFDTGPWDIDSFGVLILVSSRLRC